MTWQRTAEAVGQRISCFLKTRSSDHGTEGGRAYASDLSLAERSVLQSNFLHLRKMGLNSTPSRCAGVVATACTQGKRTQHGRSQGVVRDDQTGRP